MEIKFKNTYQVSIVDPGCAELEFNLADYNTFEEFAKVLKAHKVKWDKEEGCFICNGDDENLSFVISEKEYGCVADWCHPELESYMRENLYDGWGEDGDSVFFAPELKLKDAFNQLKKIDGVEIELVCEIEPGEYVNQYVGPYQYGEAWEQIKTVSEAKTTYSVDLETEVSEDFPRIETIEFVDWEAIDKMLNSQK